jgi:hypothetical protein
MYFACEQEAESFFVILENSDLMQLGTEVPECISLVNKKLSHSLFFFFPL